MINYLQQGRTINGAYYAACIRKLQERGEENLLLFGRDKQARTEMD